MTKLFEIIPIEKKDLSNYKLHFAIGGADRDNKEPLYELRKNKFESWQAIQSRKNFERKYIFSLIYYTVNHEWIYGGIYKRNGVRKAGKDWYYDTELLEYKKDLIDRLIIHYEKNFRQSYTYLENYYDDLEVSKIL